MLGSISPVGEAARTQRWWLTATAYLVASAAGGVAVGALSGAAGQAIAAVAPSTEPLRLALLAAVLAAAALVDADVVGAGPPTWRRQVDERWLTTYRGWVYGAGFGAQLGAGVVTIVTSASVYAMLAAALLSMSTATGALVGGVFGVTRALPLVAMAPVRTAPRLYAVTRRVAAAGAGVRRATVGGLVALAVIASTATLVA